MDELEQAANLLARLYLDKAEGTGRDESRTFEFGKYDFYYHPQILDNEKRIFITIKISE